MQNSVGKGLWREEIPYVMDMLNMCTRPQLLKMLSWYVGVETDFTCSVGKAGKYLKRYLSQEQYQQLIKTYPQGETENIWQSVFTMCGLFEKTAKTVAEHLGYPYNEEEARGSRLFLDCTYRLPGDAEDILVEEGCNVK